MASDFTIGKTSPILITGSGGFLGKNLVAQLKADGYENLLLFDINSPQEALAGYAKEAAFVFHLAGVNRPKDNTEFYSGNADLTQRLLQLLQKAGNRAPFLLTSSAQAGNGTDYAKSKEAAEAAVFAHAQANESPVFVYRLPGLFGKWSRPAYNSVVATFCHNIAHGLPIEVRDADYALPLCYVDDVMHHFRAVLQGKTPAAPIGDFLEVGPVYDTTLVQLAALIKSFKHSRDDLHVPDMQDAFITKLYATYLSYLPEDDFAYPLIEKKDERGSFTEFLRTLDRGQVSINVAKPGITKGNHWHNTKNEKFLVVRGRAVIRFRKIGSEEIIAYTVSGDELTVVDIPVGYTHHIENIGTDDLVTVMWASEPFDVEHPDTYYEKV